MSNYEDIKAGDKVYESIKVGIMQWRACMYAKTFYVEREVLKATKTQFTTDTGRYRKSDGYGIGDCNSVYMIGEKPKWANRDNPEVIRCERIELANYQNELQVVKDAMYLDFRRIDITKLSLDKAQKAAGLIKELTDMFKLEKGE